MTRLIEDAEDYLNTQVIDDKDLVSIVLRVGLSAYTKEPLNLMVKAPSSEGKSYTVSQVISLFPENDVMILGGMSPTALIHEKGILVDGNNQPVEARIESLEEELEECKDPNQKKEIKREIKEIKKNAKTLVDLNGKLLVFLDTPNWGLWRKLKPILSHDSETIQFKIADRMGGALTTKTILIRGWPAVIYCSARNEERFSDWAEIQTRFLIASPNTEIGKYKKANFLTSIRKSIPSFAGTLLNPDPVAKDRAKFALGILKEVLCKSKNNDSQVYNPFYKVIAESLPNNEGATMRIAKQFFALCNLESIINSPHNYKILYGIDQSKIECPITSLWEIKRAVELLGKPSPLPPDKVKFFEQIFEPATTSKLDGEITSTELATRYTERTGKPITSKRILENFLEPLCDIGVIDWRVSPIDARSHLFKKLSDINKRNLEGIVAKIIEQSKIDPSFVESGISELEKHSSGGSLLIADSVGNTIPKDKLQALLIGSVQTNVDGTKQAQA